MSVRAIKMYWLWNTLLFPQRRLVWGREHCGPIWQEIWDVCSMLSMPATSRRWANGWWDEPGLRCPAGLAPQHRAACQLLSSPGENDKCTNVLYIFRYFHCRWTKQDRVSAVGQCWGLSGHSQVIVVSSRNTCDLVTQCMCHFSIVYVASWHDNAFCTLKTNASQICWTTLLEKLKILFYLWQTGLV